MAEQFPDEGPRFIIEPNATLEERSLIGALEEEARNNPDRTLAALRFHRFGLPAVRGAVDYFGQYPDGAGTLTKIADFLDARADRAAEFEPETEKAAERAEPTNETIRKNNLTKEEVRDATRRGRLRIFTERRKAYQEEKAKKSDSSAA